MCWKCGNKANYTNSVSRSETCSVCGADVRSCKNCKFYEPGAHYDCHETIDELVQDKERANFCDYFCYKVDSNGSAQNDVQKQNARAAFDKLFGA